MPRTTSAAGRAAITQREGCRLTAYRDTVGVWTIGVGHSSLAPTPPPVRAGMTITAAEADEILSRDLAVFERAVNAADARGRLGANAFDACVSLAFNIGCAAFARSTVARKVAEGDMPAAAEAFLLWNKPAVLAGRRRAEMAQFLAPDAFPTIAVDRDKPVLAGIEAAVNRAAARMPAVAPLPVLTPGRVDLIKTDLPRSGLGAWLRSLFSRKAA